MVPNNPLTRSVIYVLLIAAAGAAGYYSGKGDIRTRVVEKLVTQKETKWRDHIVTVTRTVHPDGTITETTKTEEKEGESSSHSKGETLVSEATLPKYSLGLSYGIRYTDLLPDVVQPSVSQVQLEFGRRIVGPLWGEVGVGIQRVTLGVRMEF